MELSYFNCKLCTIILYILLALSYISSSRVGTVNSDVLKVLPINIGMLHFSKKT